MKAYFCNNCHQRIKIPPGFLSGNIFAPKGIRIACPCGKGYAKIVASDLPKNPRSKMIDNIWEHIKALNLDKETSEKLFKEIVSEIRSEIEDNVCDDHNATNEKKNLDKFYRNLVLAKSAVISDEKELLWL